MFSISWFYTLNGCNLLFIGQTKYDHKKLQEKYRDTNI